MSKYLYPRVDWTEKDTHKLVLQACFVAAEIMYARKRVSYQGHDTDIINQIGLATYERARRQWKDLRDNAQAYKHPWNFFLSCAWAVAASTIKQYKLHNLDSVSLDAIVDAATEESDRHDADALWLANKRMPYTLNQADASARKGAQRRGPAALDLWYDLQQYHEYCDDCADMGRKPLSYAEFNPQQPNSTYRGANAKGVTLERQVEYKEYCEACKAQGVLPQPRAIYLQQGTPPLRVDGRVHSVEGDDRYVKTYTSTRKYPPQAYVVWILKHEYRHGNKEGQANA